MNWVNFQKSFKEKLERKIKEYWAKIESCREVQRILLELLNQMDGFDQTTNVKVIMATSKNFLFYLEITKYDPENTRLKSKIDNSRVDAEILIKKHFELKLQLVLI